jgi:hypothetical protein
MMIYSCVLTEGGRGSGGSGGSGCSTCGGQRDQYKIDIANPC